VKLFHNNPEALMSFAPEGRDPEVIHCPDEASTRRTLRQVLYRLIEEEHIDNHDLIILTPRSLENSFLTGAELGNFLLTNHPPTNPTQVQVTSIHRFKGLEKCVVILAEIGEHMTHNQEMLLYVGCSRARTHLIILHDGTIPVFSDNVVNATET
jgi:superfamily I DNA/RNA helicase